MDQINFVISDLMKNLEKESQIISKKLIVLHQIIIKSDSSVVVDEYIELLLNIERDNVPTVRHINNA